MSRRQSALARAARRLSDAKERQAYRREMGQPDSIGLPYSAINLTTDTIQAHVLQEEER